MGRTWSSNRFSSADPAGSRPDRSRRVDVGGTRSYPGSMRTIWGSTGKGFKWTISLHGFPKFRATMSRIHAESKMSLAAALYEEGVGIINESKETKNVPVKSGLLKSTGHVMLPQTEGDRLVVWLGYGNNMCNYAKVQHEGKFNHPRGGRRHFLLIPAQNAARTMGPRIARKIGKKIEGLVVVDRSTAYTGSGAVYK